jgi:uncharacterized membrane protein YsdA (DUF1294 family)
MQFPGSLLYWTPAIYILIINLVSYTAMWWDKWKATRHEWRVAEASLHVVGIIGGAIGIFAAMYTFRHKTQKRSFQALALMGLIVSLVIYWITIQIYI